jgi:protein-tyrosine-phosphatase
MSEPTDPGGSAQSLDTHVLARTAEHLAQLYTGMFSSDLVERMVFESYATLARTARVRTHLAPLAGHFAADRLAALAHTRASTAETRHTEVPQVLFVGEHDTGRAPMAAALLAHHAGNTLKVRSAGLLPGAAPAPLVVTVLAERGIDAEGLYPKPVTDDVVAAADWVITFGTLDGIPLPAGATHQDWDVEDVLEADPGAMAAAVEKLEDQIQVLYERIRTHPPAPPGH